MFESSKNLYILSNPIQYSKTGFCHEFNEKKNRDPKFLVDSPLKSLNCCGCIQDKCLAGKPLSHENCRVGLRVRSTTKNSLVIFGVVMEHHKTPAPLTSTWRHSTGILAIKWDLNGHISCLNSMDNFEIVDCF